MKYLRKSKRELKKTGIVVQQYWDARFQSLDTSAQIQISLTPVKLSTLRHKTFRQKIVNLSMARFQPQSLSSLQQKLTEVDNVSRKLKFDLTPFNFGDHNLMSSSRTHAYLNQHCGGGLRRGLFRNSSIPHLSNFTQIRELSSPYLLAPLANHWLQH